MTTVIKDGRTGTTAEIDSSNRLRTFAITQKELTSSSLDGDTFFITSDIETLTTANESFIFHMENTDSVDWIVDSFATLYGKSTGGTGIDFKQRAVLNETGGTLISAGTAITPLNMNIGSPKTLTGIFLQGVEGSTITGGTSVPDALVLKDQIFVSLTSGVVIIAAGTSVNVGITPPTGNTSLNVQATFIIHRNVT